MECNACGHVWGETEVGDSATGGLASGMNRELRRSQGLKPSILSFCWASLNAMPQAEKQALSR